MKPVPTLPTLAHGEEQVQVVRVKLRRPGGSAVVGEMRAADTLVARWAALGNDTRMLSFEITFDDGYALFGDYDYGRSKRHGHSFSRFMRAVFKALRQAPPSWPNGIYSLTVPTVDLAHYVIDGS